MKNLKVLHVPYTWAPDPVGGTERYVEDLVAGLAEEGVDSVVAAPGMANTKPGSGGGAFRYVVPDVSGPEFLEELYGDGSAEAAQALVRIAVETGAGIVHLHSYTRGSGLAALTGLKALGFPVVFTYHTPTVSCPRGTMMLMGKTACDGWLDSDRCTGCLLQSQGLPASLSGLGATVSRTIGGTRALSGRAGRGMTGFRTWHLLENRSKVLREFLSAVDRIVVPAKWVEDLLARNGIEIRRVVKIPQPVPRDSVGLVRREPREGSRPVVLFLGRVSQEKGLDLLLKAVGGDRSLDVDVKVYAVVQSESENLRFMRLQSGQDERFQFWTNRPRAEALDALRGADVLVVPSRCLETGPLVLLEALAVGISVVGAALGAIEERLRPGIDGVLFRSGDPSALRKAIRAALAMPRGIPEGRFLPLVRDVARQHVQLYEEVAHAGRRAA